MPEFFAQGRITLEGVIFYIDAVDEAEAREKAAKGLYRTYNPDDAGVVDWKVWPDTLEINE